MKEKVPSFDEMMVLFAETRKQIEANARDADARAKEAEARAKEADARWKEICERAAKTEAELAEAIKTIMTTNSELAGVGFGNGQFAESAVSASVKANKVFAGIQFDDVKCRLKGDDVLPNGKTVMAEFDTVLFNGTAVAVIEAKYRVKRRDLLHLIYVQLPTFRRAFPQYRDFKIYLGLGGMSFDDGVEEEALLRGVGTLKLGGNALEINDKDAKAW